MAKLEAPAAAATETPKRLTLLGEAEVVRERVENMFRAQVELKAKAKPRIVHMSAWMAASLFGFSRDCVVTNDCIHDKLVKQLNTLMKTCAGDSLTEDKMALVMCVLAILDCLSHSLINAGARCKAEAAKKVSEAHTAILGRSEETKKEYVALDNESAKFGCTT